jgi:hypothetical protein
LTDVKEKVEVFERGAVVSREHGFAVSQSGVNAAALQSGSRQGEALGIAWLPLVGRPVKLSWTRAAWRTDRKLDSGGSAKDTWVKPRVKSQRSSGGDRR